MFEYTAKYRGTCVDRLFKKNQVFLIMDSFDSGQLDSTILLFKIREVNQVVNDYRNDKRE